MSTAIPHEFVTPNPVPVLEETVIPDVCEALLEQERAGVLRIVRYAQRTEESREWTRREEAQTILEQGLLRADSDFARYMQEKYPDSWAMAQAHKKETEQ